MKTIIPAFICWFFLMVSVGMAGEPNLTNDSLEEAVAMLQNSVYHDHAQTFFCEALFDSEGVLTLPEGFETKGRRASDLRLAWGHIVPVEEFGPAFPEWSEGHLQCLDNKKIAFTGHACAEKTSVAFRQMQADMYNLYPMINFVKEARVNHNFGMVSGVASSFGSCQMKIGGRRMEPPAMTRGQIARTYMYMAEAYPQFVMSDYRANLMQAWDSTYPVSAWECTRAKRIEALQGNENSIAKAACEKKGLWGE